MWLRKLYKLLRPVQHKQQVYLGRWHTVIHHSDPKRAQQAIQKNVEWSNHDHCGGVQCQTPPSHHEIKKR